MAGPTTVCCRPLPWVSASHHCYPPERPRDLSAGHNLNRSSLLPISAKHSKGICKFSRHLAHGTDLLEQVGITSLQYDDSMMYRAALTSPGPASWTPVAWRSSGRTLSVSGIHVPATGYGAFMRGIGIMGCCPVKGVRLRARRSVRPVQNLHAASRNAGTPTRSLTTPCATYADAQKFRRDHP